jgi:hypothetical protein
MGSWRRSSTVAEKWDVCMLECSKVQQFRWSREGGLDLGFGFETSYWEVAPAALSSP